MNKYKWVIWVDGELDSFIGSNNIPKVGDTVYVSSLDSDCDDEAVIKEFTALESSAFDVEAERVRQFIGDENYPEPPPPKITDRPMKQRGF